MASFESLEFYRGLSSRYDIQHPSVHYTRKGRRPRDVAENLHQIADSWFSDRFGVRYRSDAIFVSSNLNVVAAYAYSPEHIARIIPLGAYSYCWSSRLTDLLEVCLRKPREDELIEELNDADYKETDLESAYRMGHEVMLSCDSYICIPMNVVVQRHD